MKKQELEKKIGTAIENATPNKLDSIMNACDTQKKTTIIEMPKQKKGGWKKALKATSAVAAVLILVLCLSVILNPGTKSSAESVILRDVMYKATDAFWLIQFATTQDDYEKMKEDIFKFAGSVTFAETVTPDAV